MGISLLVVALIFKLVLSLRFTGIVSVLHKL